MSPEELYHLHKRSVYHLCLRFCGGQVALAEDLAQDVFVKMLEHMDQLSALGELEPWLYRVTTNTCFTRLKRDTSVWRKVMEALSMQPKATTSSPEQQLQLREELQHVLGKLKDIPAQERIVFCMYVLDEKPQQEICEILSLSKGYVSKLLKRARLRLREGGEDV